MVCARSAVGKSTYVVIICRGVGVSRGQVCDVIDRGPCMGYGRLQTTDGYGRKLLFNDYFPMSFLAFSVFTRFAQHLELIYLFIPSYRPTKRQRTKRRPFRVFCFRGDGLL